MQILRVNKESIKWMVEQTLLKLFGDPDEGLPIRKETEARLLHQKAAVADGARGKSLKDVVKELGLE